MNTNSTTRRTFTAIAVAAALGATAISSQARAEYVEPNIEHPAYGEVRMVVPIATDDEWVWTFRLRNIGNAIRGAADWEGETRVKVELYGPGLRMLVDPSDKLAASIDYLRGEGVEFEVCNNTMRALDLNWQSLYGVEEKDIVPSGFLEVAWLANEGWAVNPMY
ncbi:MAG: DsrE family protein [Halothiobacillaceae bacterium]|nr:DsrE family protein [Halothiobacillaceae bacterium]HER35717.1 hypothetical protein [Halothiobacillaceae bacterium]